MPEPVVLVPVMTTAGLQAVFTADGLGLQAEITHIALGDQGYEPGMEAVGLQNELLRISIAGGEVIPDSVQIHLTAVADAGTPEFWVREVGFVLSDGTFLAIWSDASLALAYRSSLSDLLLALDVVLAGVPAGSVTVQEGELYVGQATTTRQGVVRLATQAEADVGDEPEPVITPETLGGVLARLPIYPQVHTADHHMAVTDNGDGTIKVNWSQAWTWRGWRVFWSNEYSTAERTFAVIANKTYHLRWSPSDGFALKDVSDAAYNPGAQSESDVSFDTDYDDMLIARVVTDGAGAVTITTLANAVRLKSESVIDTVVQLAGADGANGNYSHNWLFSRTPTYFVGFFTVTNSGTTYQDIDNTLNGGGSLIGSRYGISGNARWDYAEQIVVRAIGFC